MILIYLIIIISSILPVIVGIIWFVNIMKNSNRIVNNPYNWGVHVDPIDRIFNTQMENLLQQILEAQRMQNLGQAIRLQETMQEQITRLPSKEKKIYKAKLNDVVKKNMELNPSTGQWEET